MKIDGSFTGIAGKEINRSVNEKQNKEFEEILRKASGDKEDKDEAQLKRVCNEMEAVFWHQILKQLRKTAYVEDGLLGNSSSKEIYQDMLDTEHSKLLAESSGKRGLAETLFRQLNQTNLK